ncbi:MAG: hypothetical protein AB1505_03650 [Candidatus Latescibacterota bacterium]
MNMVYLAAAIALVILTLVVRDQTEFRLSRLRSELVALRSEEKRLSEEREDLERTIVQIGDALLRADSRQTAAGQVCRQVGEALAAMGVEVGALAPAEPPEAGPTS